MFHVNESHNSITPAKYELNVKFCFKYKYALLDYVFNWLGKRNNFHDKKSGIIHNS